MQASKILKNIIENGSNQKNKLYRWIEILGFIIVLVAVLKILSYVMNPVRLNMPNAVNERDRYVVSALTEEADSMDVVVLGDSESEVLLSPQILWEEEGISSYICGQPAQRLSEAYFFLKDLLVKQHPKVVIIETNTMVLGTNWKLESLTYADTLAYHEFPILRYHHGYLEMWGLKDAPAIKAERGFEKREQIAPYSGPEYMVETGDTYRIDFVAGTYIDKIYQLCKKEDISLVLVSAPSAVNMNYAKHNAIQNWADHNEVDYIDFNTMLDEIELDWQTDSLDGGDHINYNGTVKTTEYIRKYLKENYELKDHRDD